MSCGVTIYFPYTSVHMSIHILIIIFKTVLVIFFNVTSDFMDYELYHQLNFTLN